MKRFLLLAICLTAFACARTQTVFTHTFDAGHIHVTVRDSTSHDTSLCGTRVEAAYSITIDSSYTNDTLRIVDSASGSLYRIFTNSTGISPWTVVTYGFQGTYDDAAIPVSGGYAYFPETPKKVTTSTDTLRYVTYLDSLWILPCIYSSVSGKVYIDNNSNCLFDAGDETIDPMILPDVLEYLSSPVGTTRWNHAWNSGVSYTLYLQESWLINYTVSLPPAYAFIFPMSPCFTGPYAFTSVPQTGVDFPLQCSSNIDLHCGELSPSRIRWHTPFYMHPYVANTGCDTISGTMTMVKDHRVIYNATLSVHPADTVRGDTLIWNYTHLTSISSGGYWNSFMSDVYLDQDTTVVPGDTLCFRVYTNIPSSDVNIFNNDYSVCFPVVYSFDPNSKEMSPASTGTDEHLPPNTDELTYTIDFQNTGSDYAYEVKIIDTLDGDIDPHSLKILGTSHNMEPKWLTSNVVEFYYKNIMLPDSTTSEPRSHGQVRFSVKLRSGLPVGTHIKNTGYIYFDANPAVITNTTHGITSLPSSTPQLEVAKNIKVYPNPATDELTIENATASNVYVLNMAGAIIQQQHIAANKATIDISRLPAGVYVLKTISDTNTSTIKFSKY